MEEYRWKQNTHSQMIWYLIWFSTDPIFILSQRGFVMDNYMESMMLHTALQLYNKTNNLLRSHQTQPIARPQIPVFILYIKEPL